MGAARVRTMQTSTPQHRFGLALQEWRARRRVSQLELALRARTTQRHISFIESGRSSPGRAMVIRLAEALEIPLRERNLLLALAGYAPVYTETSLDHPSLGAVREALDSVLDGHNPYPAVVTNRYGELISNNRAFITLTEGTAPHLLTPQINVPRLLLHPDGLAPRIANLDEWGWHIVDAVRQEALRNPDPKLEALAEELATMAPAMKAPTVEHVGFAVPLRLRWGEDELRLLSTLTHFGTAVDVTVAELKLEAFLPADAPTSALLNQLDRDIAPTLPERREEAIAKRTLTRWRE
jgi:transcriptional regulator with XRE-family HTH domain